MRRMATVKNAKLSDTATFQLGVVGAGVSQRFADRITPLDLKPSHVGVLTILANAPAKSQQDIATALNVAPSLVVKLADHLEAIGAIERTRDPDDRRRQTLRLTEHGRARYAECTAITHDLEKDLLAGLSPAERGTLIATLQRVAANLIATNTDA
jgi:DNA-binding MarR family transcriptional regulator